MRTRSSTALLSAVAALALAAAGVLGAPRVAYAQPPSAADIAQARELFNVGTDLRERGDIAGALEKLRAAHSLAATPITGLELGRTYVSAGKLVEAREVLLGVGRLAVAPQETARSAAARTSAAQLAEQVRGRIPKLSVRITGAPLDAVTVTIDGSAVPAEGLTSPRLINPGKHEVAATPTGGARATASVELKEGESREVQLHVTPAAAPATPAGSGDSAGTSSTSPTKASSAAGGGLAGADRGLPNDAANPEQHSGGRALVYIGFGLAAVGAAVGGVTGFIEMGKASSVNDACRGGTTCPRSIDDDLQTGRTMGNISTIAFAAAGVGAVVGVVALIVGHKKETAPPAAAWVTPWVAPGGGGVSGVARF